jgi:hypothetical protein
MRRLAAVLLACGMVFVPVSEISACGDKFLLVGRGMRLQRAYAALHPASIVVLVAPKSKTPAVTRDPQLVTTLRRAGHDVRTISDRAGLELPTELTTGRFDVIVAEHERLLQIAQRIALSPHCPILVPVLYRPSESTVAEVSKQFACVLMAPDTLVRFLSAIDNAMKTRLAERATSLTVAPTTGR